MSLDAMKQALEALEEIADEMFSSYDNKLGDAILALRAAIEQATRKQSLQVPPEVVDSLTTTDIAWLATHRLTNLWIELGQMRWAGTDKSWDLAIEAVRNRINDECQSVLDWKAQADQSQATAIELLQKMQSLENGQ
jgi:hypothetical protein